METQVYKIIVNGRAYPNLFRAVDKSHALDRYAQDQGFSTMKALREHWAETEAHRDLEVKEVEDFAGFDDKVDWGEARADTAQALGIIKEGEEVLLGDTVDPPTDREVLEFVLINEHIYLSDESTQ